MALFEAISRSGTRTFEQHILSVYVHILTHTYTHTIFILDAHKGSYD